MSRKKLPCLSHESELPRGRLARPHLEKRKRSLRRATTQKLTTRDRTNFAERFMNLAFGLSVPNGLSKCQCNVILMKNFRTQRCIR
jgi:hypothetical protein